MTSTEQNLGVAPLAPGHSAKPEPVCAVSAAPAASVPNAALHEAQRLLLLAAVSVEADYVGFRLHTRENGHTFYGVNFHKGSWVRSALGNTLAEAFEKAAAATAHYYPAEAA